MPRGRRNQPPPSLGAPTLDKLVASSTASRPSFFASLEDMIASPDGFGITTLTPLQRAICRIVSGAPLGDLIAHEHVAPALGLNELELREWEAARIMNDYPIPKELFVIAGIRTFKSLLIAATAIWATQHVTIANLGPGEIPRYSILSLKVDNAKVVINHLLGALQQPGLEHLRVKEDNLKGWSGWAELIKESKAANLVGSAFLWHPSLTPIEIRVVAGSRAGGSVVSRWSAGCALDEAPRMVGQEQGVINYTDIRRSVMGRLLPGAQLFSVGSPWASVGPVYDIVQEWWGQPRKDLVIFKAQAPHLNPYWWTPEECAALKEKDEVAYQMDVLAEFPDAGESLIPQTLINRCTREDSVAIPYEWGHEYSAAMDPATRGNAWTLVVVDRVSFEDEAGVLRYKKRVVCHTQWIGTQLSPLRPRVVLTEIAEILREYHLDYAYTDQYMADAIRDIALGVGLALIIENWTGQEQINHYLALRASMTEGEIEIPNDPFFQRDLKMVRRVINNRGPSIMLPETLDGRHCDYAPAFLRAVSPYLDPERKPEPKYGTDEYMNAELERWRQAAAEKVRKGKTGAWLELNPWTDAQSVFEIGQGARRIL